MVTKILLIIRNPGTLSGAPLRNTTEREKEFIPEILSHLTIEAKNSHDLPFAN